MEIKKIKLNTHGKLIKFLWDLLIFVLFMTGAPAWGVCCPLLLLALLLHDYNSINPTMALCLIIFSCFGFLVIYGIKKNFDTRINTWLEQNFGRENLTSNKASIQETFSEYNHNKNVLRTPNSSYKTNLSNYVDKETNRIIKENHITNNTDKKAAEFVAINNIQHSPEKLSEIFDTTIDKAKDIEESISIEEEKRVSNHISYEGRITAKDKNRMKALLGYKCTACGADMSEIYGNIGHNYIELHHKIPYSKIKENETRTLTEKEFCVLCPNCHRMIHKLPDAGDIDLLSRIIKLNKTQ